MGLKLSAGYCNNIPCDVMRQDVGSEGKVSPEPPLKTLRLAMQVIAVDVENKDNAAFEGVAALSGDGGGVSGWRILGLSLISKFVRTGFKWPSYSQLQYQLAFVVTPPPDLAEHLLALTLKHRRMHKAWSECLTGVM